MAAIYYIRSGDTLSGIALKNNTTVKAILDANLICDPNLITVDQVLLIPDTETELPRAGVGPYYLVQPGDTLYCLAQKLGTTVRTLAVANQIPDPNKIRAGAELLVANSIPNPVNLKTDWERTGGVPCSEMNSLQVHGIYYLGSYQWASLNRRAVPYLLQLLKNPCDTVRFYTVMALGHIALDREVSVALNQLANDPAVSSLVGLVRRRIVLAGQGKKKVHLNIREVRLYSEPRLDASYSVVPAGTEVEVLRWFIPSPGGEEGPRGDIQVYDRVQVLATGRVGFIPRVGFNEVLLV